MKTQLLTIRKLDAQGKLSREALSSQLPRHRNKDTKMVNPVSTLRLQLAVVACCFLATSISYADVFGGGVNTFDIDFVSIGNPGNPADTTGNPNPAGSVGYSYRMGKFEVSRDVITKASAEGGLGITLADMTSFGGNGVSRPATGVSWNEAARFVNWLNTSTGSTAAYKFEFQPGEAGYSANANIQLWDPGDAGYNANNLFRNRQARYVLPSFDEWYKAAYYDPTSGTYFDYPTGSDTAPTGVASGTGAGTAVYNGQSGPADVNMAGGLSPYGTMGQGGNALEMEETEFDLVNDSSLSRRGLRGGYWHASPGDSLRSSFRVDYGPPTLEDALIGFRVASVPEPSSLLLGALGTIGLLIRRRR